MVIPRFRIEEAGITVHITEAGMPALNIGIGNFDPLARNLIRQVCPENGTGDLRCQKVAEHSAGDGNNVGPGQEEV